jgi:hypothetical protein
MWYQKHREYHLLFLCFASAKVKIGELGTGKGSTTSQGETAGHLNQAERLIV